ncbi:hypothetical protein V6N13_069590 [Hibiscus sabdariffa]
MLSQENVIGKLPTSRVYEEPGGQPPDETHVLPLQPLLERPPSPSPLEGENGSKRVRNTTDGIGQFDTIAMETKINSNITRDVGETPLFKVRSNGMDNSRDKNTTDFFDKETKILAEDIIVNTSGSIPSIQFSNRVGSMYGSL